MNLKNYTTKIKAETSILEIEKMLVLVGATDISKKYNNYMVSILIFNVGDLKFRLPCQFDKIRLKLIELKQSKKLAGISKSKASSLQHSYNVGWRILKNWIEIQLSLIQINLVSLEEIFLPYMYDENKGKTFYELIEERNFKLLEGSN